MTAPTCPVCERPFGSPNALHQHQRATGHGTPDWPAVRRGRRRGGKRTRPPALMDPATALELYDDGEGYAGLAMAMEAAGYEPGDEAEFLMAAEADEP